MQVPKEKKEDSQWDKKKIILFLVAAIILLGIGFELKSAIIGESEVANPQKQSVKGAQTQAEDKLPDVGQNIRDRISS